MLTSVHQDLWLITVDSRDAKKELLRGLQHDGSQVTIRQYEDVVEEQARQQQRLQEVSRMIHSIGVQTGGSRALTEFLAQEEAEAKREDSGDILETCVQQDLHTQLE